MKVCPEGRYKPTSLPLRYISQFVVSVWVLNGYCLCHQRCNSLIVYPGGGGGGAIMVYSVLSL